MDYPKIHVALKSQAKPIKKDKEGAWVKIEPFLPATTKWNMYNVPGEKNARLGNPYESKEDYPMAKNKCRKDEDGRVTIGPKNMLASPIHPGHYNSTIWHTITPYPEYIGDVYDADRHAEYIKQKPWNIKYAEQNYFKGMSSGPYPLNKDRNVYGYPPALGPNKKTWSYKNKVGHDNPFKPSHPNHGGKMGTFTKFQRLIPDPSAIHKATRRPPPENPKDAFRPSRGVVSKPSPSVSLNFMNIRSAVRG